MNTARPQSSRLVIGDPEGVAALEFKTFAFPLVGPATTDLPAPPGAVQRDPAGRAALVHFAPGRFLAPEPTADLVRHLGALAATGIGVIFDVTGKWQHLVVHGSDASRLLAATIDVAAVLVHRECAALRLFDCPSVLATRPGGFDIWVEASYALDLRTSLERVGGRL
jgi:hypothetical protein